MQRSGLGSVILDRRGVKSDIAHGIGRAKAATFAAVPAVIQQGRQIDYQQNWKGRGYDTYVFAAPVELAGKPTYVAAVVRSGADNRFYLHEVIDEDGNLIYKIDAPEAIKTGVTADNGITGTSETSISKTIPQPKQTVNKPRIRTEQAEETLTPAQKPVNLLANSGTEANTNEQAKTAVGAEQRTSTGEAQDGAALPDRDRGRRDGKHTDRPIGRLARGTKEWRNLPQREKAARRSLHANALGLRDTDGAELGIQNSAGTVKVYPESEWEDDLQNIQKVLTKATGMPVTYVVGPIKVNGMAKGDVRGVFTRNRIIIRIDERTTSTASLAGLSAQLGSCCCDIKTTLLQDKYDAALRELNKVQTENATKSQSEYLLSVMGKWVANPAATAWCHG